MEDKMNIKEELLQLREKIMKKGKRRKNQNKIKIHMI